MPDIPPIERRYHLAWVVLLALGFVMIATGVLTHDVTLDETGKYVEAASGLAFIVGLARAVARSSR